ncbi:hypothetical protein L211DRAFT_797499, partial [Terfezia boudieri ATCC MYA-4762]
LWKESEIESILRQTFALVESEDILYLYGDPVYALSYGIIGPYRATLTHALTPYEQALNVKMSSY